MNFLDDEELSPIQENPQPAPKVYKLATEKTVLGGQLADFVTDINNESSKISDSNFEHEVIPEFEETEEVITPGEQKRAKTTAEFVVKTADQIVSKLLAAYAKTDSERLEADKSDIKEISEYFAPYLTSSNFDLPPWVMGTIVASFVLFDKFKMAGEIRRVNLELEAKNEIIKEVELKNIELEAKVKFLGLRKTEKELQQKVDDLEGEVA